MHAHSIRFRERLGAVHATIRSFIYQRPTLRRRTHRRTAQKTPWWTTSNWLALCKRDLANWDESIWMGRRNAMKKQRHEDSNTTIIIGKIGIFSGSLCLAGINNKFPRTVTL